MISIAQRWLLVHVQKTGGNSLQEILHPHSDDTITRDRYRDGVEDFEVEGPVTTRKHMSLQEYHDALPPAVYRSLLKFAVVRDPWERAVSMYFGPIRFFDDWRVPELDAERFVDSLEQLTRIVDLVSVDGIVDLDVALRFERLAEGATGLFHLLGLGTPALPHRNASLRTRPWQEVYATHPELVDAVAERFADDAACFGYAPPRVGKGAGRPALGIARKPD